MDVIKNHFTPIRNRVMKVELMQGSLDIGGLVHTGHDVADANHCWRFVRRSVPCSRLKCTYFYALYTSPELGFQAT